MQTWREAVAVAKKFFFFFFFLKKKKKKKKKHLISAVKPDDSSLSSNFLCPCPAPCGKTGPGNSR